MPDTEPAAVLYDADCNICKTIMETLLTWDRRGRLRPVAIQSDAGQQLLGAVPVEERLESFHLARPGQQVISGGPALAELFDLLPGGGIIARGFGVAPATTDAAYEWIARNRVTLSRFIPRAVKARANRRLAARLEQ